jgi:RND family efflux transporter MFP subunit
VHAAAFAFALLFALGRGAPAQAAESAPSAAADAPAAVVLKSLAEVQTFPLREATATVVPRNESRLSAEVTATVVSIAVEVGQAVRKGAVVARLDDTDFRLALERARAQQESIVARLRLAEVQLERARELQQRNFVSADALVQRETEVNALRADLRASESQVATARRQITKTIVRAPFDGAVRARHAQLGELASPGSALLTLTQTGGEEVSAAVPAADVATLPGATRIAFESGAQRRALRLARIAPMVDPATRTREARLAFVDDALPAGTEGRLSWRDPRPHLPPDVLVRRGDALGVFVERDGRARFVVVPAAQEGRPALAPAGLSGRIVTEGQAALRDGQAIATR